jgi:hypothetical protein
MPQRAFWQGWDWACFEPYSTCMDHHWITSHFCRGLTRNDGCVLGVRLRCQLSVKFSRRHDVPIIVAAIVVSRRGRCAAAAQLIRDTSLPFPLRPMYVEQPHAHAQAVLSFLACVFRTRSVARCVYVPGLGLRVGLRLRTEAIRRKRSQEEKKARVSCTPQ